MLAPVPARVPQPFQAYCASLLCVHLQHAWLSRSFPVRLCGWEVLMERSQRARVAVQFGAATQQSQLRSSRSRRLLQSQSTIRQPSTRPQRLAPRSVGGPVTEVRVAVRELRPAESLRLRSATRFHPSNQTVPTPPVAKQARWTDAGSESVD